MDKSGSPQHEEAPQHREIHPQKLNHVHGTHPTKLPDPANRGKGQKDCSEVCGAPALHKAAA